MQSKEYIGIKEIMWVGASLEKQGNQMHTPAFSSAYILSFSSEKDTLLYISIHISAKKQSGEFCHCIYFWSLSYRFLLLF